MMSNTKLLIVLAILAVLLGVVVKDNFEKRNEISNLKESIATFNKAEKESAKVITEIREKVKYVKEDCNCYDAYIPGDIINRVRSN